MKGKDKFKQYLKNRNLKFTPERKDILEAVFSLNSHFDIEQLQQKLKKMNKKISRATVYRTLPLLIESNLIKETLHCQSRVKYERIYGHLPHDHMVCLRCGKIIEFRNEEIEKLQMDTCRDKGFFPVEHRLGIKGYCKECAEKLKLDINSKKVYSKK